MKKWVIYNANQSIVDTVFNLVKLYPKAKLKSLKATGDYFTVIYEHTEKLTDCSAPYIYEGSCI